jgi:nucleobase:cation symporter-1, NCS1 family
VRHQIADYFFLRGRRVSLSGIYAREASGPYAYLRGFNPAALVALAFGCALYMVLLNPLTFASSTPYRFLTASLPAALCAGIVYLAGSRVGARPRRPAAAEGARS